MSEHPIQGLMSTTMQKIREMVDVNTIIGEPITFPRMGLSSFRCPRFRSDLLPADLIFRPNSRKIFLAARRALGYPFSRSRFWLCTKAM